MATDTISLHPVFPYRSLKEKQALIKTGKLCIDSNVSEFFKRIQASEHINAFNATFPFQGSNSQIGLLSGACIAIKDVLSFKDTNLTCSSDILRNYAPPYTATSAQRLLIADAIILGATNCDEFAMGSSNETSASGIVLNPIDTSRVPGGSSGGSAAAVAASLCDAALGTDTGGSIRQPASYCGIYGLKPTYSRVSRYGLTAFASSFDSIGPMAKTTEDIALVLQAIAGFDPLDSTSSSLPVPEYAALLYDCDKKYRIGIPREYFIDGIQGDIRKRIEEVIQLLKEQGHDIISISLPHTEFATAAYYILTTAEASSNLSRYDGVKYGIRVQKRGGINDMYSDTRESGFGNEVKRRIMLGTYILSAGYYDAYYRKAQKVRRLVQKDFLDAFAEVDLILTPTTPETAFRLGEKVQNPLSMYLSDIFTTPVNLGGFPAMSVPVGLDSNNMPIGLQLIANHFGETQLLQVSYLLENNIIKAL